MKVEDRPKRRLTEELESLQRQISELQDLGWESPAEPGTEVQPNRDDPIPPHRDESHLYGAIIDRNPDGILAFDREFAITYWNDQMELISDAKRETVLGRNAADVFSAIPEIGENRCLLRALKGESFTVTGRPFRISHLEQEGFFDGKYGPLRDSSGEIRGGYGIIRDITDRRKVEETLKAVENRYRELFENANDMVYTHDLEGFLTSLNKAAERITGFSRAESSSSPPTTKTPPAK